MPGCITYLSCGTNSCLNNAIKLLRKNNLGKTKLFVSSAIELKHIAQMYKCIHVLLYLMFSILVRLVEALYALAK